MASCKRVVYSVTGLVVYLLIMSTSFAQNASSPSTTTQHCEGPDDRLTWFREARFGMFIHWGPVSLKGTEIGWSRGKEVPAEEYDDLYKRFNPTRFDADEWVRIAKMAGMKYVVITSKHHDGFCIWPSEFTDYDLAATPFGRDILRELADACRKHGLKFCTYYSVCDWYHSDYPTESPGGKGAKANPNMPRYFEYLKNQTRELIEKYGPIGIMWFDGEWELPWTVEYGDELYGYLRRLQPDLIINNRVGKGRHGMAGTTKQDAGNPGDFDTPEQRIGGFNRNRPWETCMTICRQWAWKPNDKMKSLGECIHALVRTVGGDGNFLFNVGPMPDGLIEPRQVERLKEIGDWLGRYGESVYGTRGGPFKPGPFGASTCRGSRVYLHILDWPEDTVFLPRLPREIKHVSVLTGGDATITWSPDGAVLSMPAVQRDLIDTIVVLDLDKSAETVTPIDWRIPSGSLAYGRSVSASNVFRNRPEYSATMAVDDDPSTRWATDGGTKAAWLEIDLGEPRTLSRVRIREATEFGDRVQRFRIEYKTDGAWKVVIRGTTVGRDFDQSFPSISARHIRLNILETTEGPTIWEFHVFGANTGSQPTP